MTNTLPCCWDTTAATSLRAVGMSAIRRHPAVPAVGLAVGRALVAVFAVAAMDEVGGEPVADDAGGAEQPRSTAAKTPATVRITPVTLSNGGDARTAPRRRHG